MQLCVNLMVVLKRQRLLCPKKDRRYGCRYMLHFWSDGSVYIIRTEHPPRMEIPDDDIRELHQWCVLNGWRLMLHNNLIDDPKSFEFWMNVYRSGLIDSKELSKYESDEMERFQKAVEQDKKEDDEDVDQAKIQKI